MDPLTYFSAVVADLIIKDLRSQDEGSQPRKQCSHIDKSFRPQSNKTIENAFINSKAFSRRLFRRTKKKFKESSNIKTTAKDIEDFSRKREEKITTPDDSNIEENLANPCRTLRLQDTDLLEIEFFKLQFLHVIFNSSMISKENFKKCFFNANFSNRNISVTLRYQNNFSHIQQYFKSFLASNPTLLKFKEKVSELKMLFNFVLHFGITALLSVLLKGALNHLTNHETISDFSPETISLIEFCINIAALTDFTASTFELIGKLLEDQSSSNVNGLEGSTIDLSVSKVNKPRPSFFKNYKFRNNFFQNSSEHILRPYFSAGFATLMSSAIEAFIFQSL